MLQLLFEEMCACVHARHSCHDEGKILCCSNIQGCKYLPLGEDMVNE